MTLVEQIARSLYAYDNGNSVPFDDADADILAPYYDLAEIAIGVMERAA
ncbi:MAG: hypothetical protein ACXVGF_04610 [Blastococcus sp.]